MFVLCDCADWKWPILTKPINLVKAGLCPILCCSDGPSLATGADPSQDRTMYITRKGAGAVTRSTRSPDPFTLDAIWNKLHWRMRKRFEVMSISTLACWVLPIKELIYIAFVAFKVIEGVKTTSMKKERTRVLYTMKHNLTRRNNENEK